MTHNLNVNKLHQCSKIADEFRTDSGEAEKLPYEDITVMKTEVKEEQYDSEMSADDIAFINVKEQYVSSPENNFEKESFESTEESLKEHREYFDVEKLIIEVKKRPALYNKYAAGYSDKSVKDKLWREVCDATVPKWSELDKGQRVEKGRHVQRKWKNIKDNFRKELNQQKKTVLGEGKRKRRQYIYYKQLLFLLPIIKDRETGGNCSSPLASEVDGHRQRDTETIERKRKDTKPSTSSSQKITPIVAKRHKKPTFEESLLQIFKNSRSEDNDEDRSFLLSLLPSFKKLPPQVKLTAKMEFLRILQQLAFPSNCQGAGIIRSFNQIQNQTQQNQDESILFTSFGRSFPNVLSPDNTTLLSTSDTE